MEPFKVQQQHHDGPPVGLVIVRDTPPRVRNSTTSSSCTIKNSFSSTPGSAGRVPSLSGAFRLQPRGGKSTILLPTPSPSSRGTVSCGLFSGGSGGRKRGAQCLAPTLAGSTGIQRRALFPSKAPPAFATSSYGSASMASTPCTTSSVLACSPREAITSGFLPPDASPSVMENALQYLSLESPVQTPQSQQQRQIWKGGESSSFHLYGSPMNGVANHVGFVFPGRRIGETICSTTSAMTPSSTSRFSPRHASVQVIHKDGSHRADGTGLFSKRADDRPHESPMTMGTPPRRPPCATVQKNVGTPETHPCTPRLQDPLEVCHLSTLHCLPTPSRRSRSRSFPSPRGTPLPRVKLTPRSTPRADSSPAATMSFASPPQDLILHFSPGFAGIANNPGGSGRNNVSATKFEVPPTPRHNPTASSRSHLATPDWDGSSPAARRTIFHVPLRPCDDRSSNAAPIERAPVVIQSLLAPRGPHPSLSLQAMVTADAEAAALDCDGSLTDDEEDDEMFVLTDPALLIAESQETREENERPSQRRRVAVKDNDVPNTAQRSSMASQPTMHSSNQGSSSTSLLGMDLLRFTKTPTQQKPSSDRYNIYISAESQRQLIRSRSEESLKSVDLDLDSSSSDQKQEDASKKLSSPFPDGDLHTPPAMQNDPRVPSPKLLGRYMPNGPASTYAASGSAVSVYLSRSNPSDVHRTIAGLVMAQEQQHSPPMTCST